jgi:hypothetical protein
VDQRPKLHDNDPHSNLILSPSSHPVSVSPSSNILKHHKNASTYTPSVFFQHHPSDNLLPLSLPLHLHHRHKNLSPHPTPHLQRYLAPERGPHAEATIEKYIKFKRELHGVGMIVGLVEVVEGMVLYKEAGKDGEFERVAGEVTEVVADIVVCAWEVGNMPVIFSFLFPIASMLIRSRSLLLRISLCSYNHDQALSYPHKHISILITA